MATEGRTGDQYRDLEAFSGYKVYDDRGEKIGKVDDLFVDENNRPEYIGVQMGFFGLSGSTLIPMEIVRVNDRRRTIEVDESKDRVKDAPHFDRDDDITPDFEARIFGHYGLRSPAGDRGSYGDYYESTAEEVRPSREREDAAPRDREVREESRDYPPEGPSRSREESPEYREGYEAAMRDVERERERSREYPAEEREATSGGERHEARPTPSGDRTDEGGGVRIRKRGRPGQ